MIMVSKARFLVYACKIATMSIHLCNYFYRFKSFYSMELLNCRQKLHMCTTSMQRRWCDDARLVNVIRFFDDVWLFLVFYLCATCAGEQLPTISITTITDNL